MKTPVLLTATLLLLCPPAPAATQVDLAGPPGSGQFGTTIRVLPNGNFVVTDPEWDQPSPLVANVGAVYLYSPEGLLISTLRGSSPEDRVGSSGVFVLANGNFIVLSASWDNGAASNAGAVTWGNAVSGFLGGPVVTVSAANSLVGGTSNDAVGGSSPALLTNGHYVIRSPVWDNGGVVNAGAATWCNGFTGTAGGVSVANSLVGTSANDAVGESGVVALTNGHYVVRSSSWDNGGTTNVGAVTWGNGFTGISGPVTAANSLVGSSVNDQVGSDGVTALTNGHYVVRSQFWDNSATAVVNVGAVTWGDGFSGISGPVTTANSLVGSNTNDSVGNAGVTPLTNGHYVVSSPFWDNPIIPAAAADAGAVTWGDGFNGISGFITKGNSFVGSTTNDQVGGGGVIALTNGNYVVRSPVWDNTEPAAVNAGAVTWGDGFASSSGPVTATNSLVGSAADDVVGNDGVFALNNGNYVVCSRLWDNGPTADAGAVTWGNGFTGIKGTVTAANSLIGTSASDSVGNGGVLPLTNGHYVVRSTIWDNGPVSNAGAATWGNGSKGVKGPVTPANSLVGSTANDQVGAQGITALTNGHYVVLSRQWDNGPLTDVGAATWGNGFTGSKGPVTMANSLHGTQNDDSVGYDGVTALPGGHYLVRSGDWDNGPVSDAGAITWGDGYTGITGPVSPANSLVGSTASDQVGINAPAVQADGSALVRHGNWDNGPTAGAGAVTLFDGQTNPTGPVRSANSVLGTAANGGFSLVSGYDPSHRQLIVGRSSSNLVTLFRADRLRSLGLSNQPAPGAADIAYAKPGSAAVNANGQALTDFTLTGSGAAKGKNRALFAYAPLSGSDLVLQSGTPLSTLGGGLPSNAVATALHSQIFHQPQRALFQATVKGTGISAANNRLLLLDNGIGVQLLHRTGTPFPALGGAAIDSFKEVLQSHNEDHIALNYKLRPGGGVTAANDEGLLFLDHSGNFFPNVSAREGNSAVAFRVVNVGALTGRGTFSASGQFYYTAMVKPAASKAVPAVFSTAISNHPSGLIAEAGEPAQGTGGATFSSFPAISSQFGQAVVKATLKGSPPSQNEGLFVLSTGLITRKGDDIGGGLKIARIVRFWPAGPDQFILHLQLTGTGVNASNNQALVLLQTDNTYLILLRTGTPAHGIGPATVKSISAVDVNPVSGRYAVLGTLNGAPASANQALWTGDTTLGDTTPANQILRLPQLTLRKGNTYTTDATPSGVIRSIALKPALDPTGAGGRGLAQALGASDDLALFITGDRNLVEAVLLDR